MSGKQFYHDQDSVCLGSVAKHDPKQVHFRVECILGRDSKHLGIDRATLVALYGVYCEAMGAPEGKSDASG